MVEIDWMPRSSCPRNGIYYGSQRSSLPVIASESFISEKGYRLGEEVLVSVDGRGIRVRLEETIDFFPTVNPFREQFLIADLTSLVRYANLVGRENVIASADCGFSSQATYNTEVHPTVVWAKFQAMAEGAQLATKQLWG